MKSELEKLRVAHERLQLLHQVSKVIHSTLEPNEALELIVGEAVRVMRADSGSIALINPTTGYLEIQASQGLGLQATGLRLRAGNGITGWVAEKGKPARVGDVRSDPRYVVLRKQVRSELAVPLEVQDQTRGVLNVDSHRLNAFTADDEDLLRELSTQAAKVIHNTWLYEQLRLKATLFESLAQVGQTINSTLNLDDALAAITRQACLLMNAQVSSVMLLDPTKQQLVLRASHGAGPTYIKKPSLSVDESLLGVVVRRQRPLQVEDVQTSSLYQHVDVARAEGLVALLSVPLIFSGESIGVLCVYTNTQHLFSNEEINILSALAELSAIAIQKARLYERVVDIEEQLRRNEKLSALGLLAAEVAHEIRNPLTVMKMLYHSLDLKFAEGDPRTEDARIMGEKMEHLNRIVEQILDFARSSELQTAECHLNQLLEELLLLTRHRLQQQNIRLTRKFESDLPPIQGDANQLEQAFLNLILNAADAMPTGGDLTIRTQLVAPERQTEQARSIRVELKDTGRGMTDQEQKDLAFRAVLRSKKTKGTGLGLAIVSRIIENHQGSLKIRSRLNQGTTVTVDLPVNCEL